MKLNSVLVVFKKQSGSEDGTGKAASRLAELKTQHEESLETVLKTLEETGIPYELAERDKLNDPVEHDLIISVGGDGTVLACSHKAGKTPLVGVTSMPGYSVGFFCASEAGTFGKKLRDITSGKAKTRVLPLIEVSIEDGPKGLVALNDVLFAGASPAEMVRYTIEVGGYKEQQRSSGIWIAAGPGSTAAMLSSGGQRLEIDSPKLQFLVREPYPAPRKNYDVTSGVLDEGEKIVIKSRMRDAHIYIDGPKIVFPVPLDAHVTFGISKRSLSIFL